MPRNDTFSGFHRYFTFFCTGQAALLSSFKKKCLTSLTGLNSLISTCYAEDDFRLDDEHYRTGVTYATTQPT
jgi:hypothetical protein